jgi:hypothetical protein
LALAIPRPALPRDPLLERDYLLVCSRPAAFRNRAVAALATGGVVFVVLASASTSDPSDVLGRRVHLAFSWLGALFVAGTAHAEAATAVPSERIRATLPLLLASPLAPRRIAAGFLLSRILASLTGLLALLPVEALAVLMGGVSGADVLRSVGLLVVVAIYAASTGFLGGHGAPDHRTALGRGAALFAGLAGVLPLVLFVGFLFASEGRGLGASGLEPGARALSAATGAAWVASPLCGISALRGPLLPGFEGLLPHLAPAAVALVLAAAAVLLGGRRLRREAESEFVRPTAGTASVRPPGAVRDRVGARPLWWREGRPPPRALAHWGLRVATVLYAALLLWFLLDTRLRRAGPGVTPQDFLLSAPLWFLLLGAVGSGGSLIAEMREKGTLEDLRTTPLRASDYFLARPAGLLRRACPALVLTALFAAAGIALGIVHPAAPVLWLLGMALAGSFLILASAFAGAGASTVRAAARRTGFLVTGFLLLWPLLFSLLSSFGNRRAFDLLAETGPFSALVGPFRLWSDLGFGAPVLSEGALAATVAAPVWACAALVLWRFRDRVLDRALHGRDG